MHVYVLCGEGRVPLSLSLFSLLLCDGPRLDLPAAKQGVEKSTADVDPGCYPEYLSPSRQGVLTTPRRRRRYGSEETTAILKSSYYRLLETRDKVKISFFFITDNLGIYFIGWKDDVTLSTPETVSFCFTGFSDATDPYLNQLRVKSSSSVCLFLISYHI